MNAVELMKKVIANGADEKGIGDRFMGSAELYESCFSDLIEEPNVERLRLSMAKKDFAGAFAAAHALKGLAGNLGLTAYYAALSALVESLRTENFAAVEAQYAEVARQYEILKGFLSDSAAPAAPAGARETPPESAAPPPDVQTADPEISAPRAKAPRAKKRDLFIPITVALVLLMLGLVYVLFGRLVSNYKKSVTLESANHLIEINYHLKQYIENRIESDWMIAYTVAGSVAQSNFVDDDEAIVRLMGSIRSIWRASDVILYTSTGDNINISGQVEANDTASDRIVRARETGHYMTIIDSDITYTVPIETSLTYHGSRIVAVSIVKAMKSFLDDMGFSSFDGSAYMYLTDGSGKVISRLTNAAAVPTFNVMALFGEDTVASIEGETLPPRDLLTAQTPTTFLSEAAYVVSTPIETRQEPMRLIYFVPESVVNQTMDGFSGSVALSSAIVILIFVLCVFFISIYIYRIRKKQFDKALLARDHMFDLLVRKSHTAFGLFEVNEPKPVYISGNSADVVGNVSPTLYQTESGFTMRAETGAETPLIRQINESMRGWDGTTEFRSGFIRNPDATPANYFEIQLFPIGADSDEYVGIAHDVTLLQEREAATKTALEMAERANEAKTRFLSNMSHDIRTPMNAIVNMADFAIEDMHNPDKLREHLATIRESSDHLLLLINDILDMSRIESGKAVIESEPFDLRAELKRLTEIIRPLCAAKGLTLLTDFERVQTPVVLGDRVKVSQILMNLLSNAVKYTPQNGAVRFTATEAPSIREHYADIRFVVEDTGIGIAPEYLPHVFEPFSREDDKRVGSIQGTGLGLSICHSYVVAMGGVIKCASEVGEGSTFTVELFFAKADALPETQTEPAVWEVNPFIGMRCLLCEDNPTNRRIAKTILERLGFRVDTANDGREGVTKFEKSPPRTYDVIYMDIQMPVMDGYEAAAAIRASEHAQSRTIPIVAMTANVFIEDIEKARIAGMDGHIGKPITTLALIGETKTVLKRKRSGIQ